MRADAANPPDRVPGGGDSGRPDLVRLRDGSLVTVRPVNARDEPALAVIPVGLCLEARRLRFFSGAADMASPRTWWRPRAPDRFGLVAMTRRVCWSGMPSTSRSMMTRAEVAVEVADRMHGLGLGTILIERLAAVAEQRGVTRFVARGAAGQPGDAGRVPRWLRCGAQLPRWNGAVEFPTASWRLARERFGEG